MPTYDYRCPCCGGRFEFVVPIAERGGQKCPDCGTLLEQQIAAPIFKFKGRVTPGGGPDRLTADALGIPLKELPVGLRTSREDMKRIAEQAE